LTLICRECNLNQPVVSRRGKIVLLGCGHTQKTFEGVQKYQEYPIDIIAKWRTIFSNGQIFMFSLITRKVKDKIELFLYRSNSDQYLVNSHGYNGWRNHIEDQLDEISNTLHKMGYAVLGKAHKDLSGLNFQEANNAIQKFFYEKI
jgi:hypothetical protein